MTRPGARPQLAYMRTVRPLALMMIHAWTTMGTGVSLAPTPVLMTGGLLTSLGTSGRVAATHVGAPLAAGWCALPSRASALTVRGTQGRWGQSGGRTATPAPATAEVL